ncbi:hypothetical protein BKA82DRAFT_999767 [Pisolithus tinctorius]|nr:hypothetical protein BKA82DRAFT_999767 [Pisolithus tinctorius]
MQWKSTPDHKGRMHGWRSDVIEQGCLYTPRTNVESGDRDMAPSRDAESALIEARELALVTVKRAGQVRQSDDLSVMTLAIDVLDVLVRVGRELVGGKLQRLLGAVVGVSVAAPTFYAANGCCSATTFGFSQLSH